MLFGSARHIRRFIGQLSPKEVTLLAFFGVGVVGLLDYASGQELSVAFFYLGPVAIAAWYAGRAAGVSVALIACLIWFLADIETMPALSHPLISLWNALVRLGFFLSNALLLSTLRRHLTREQQLARTDALTGVLNSRAFTEQLDYSLALARRNGSPLTLAYVDLDDFKVINDRLGHNTGDRVLCEVAEALRRSCRRTDLVARLGGDEFAILLPETELGGAENVLLAVKEQLANLADLSKPGEARVTCSIGAVVFTEQPPTGSEAVRVADKLMYDVKAKGKNAIGLGVFDPEVGDVVVMAGESAKHQRGRPQAQASPA